MSVLEHRFPPPLLTLVTGFCMWLVTLAGGAAETTNTLRLVLAAPLVVLAFLTAGSAIVAFRRARTTVNPVHIDQASSLVTGGVFRLTRNPMYVGLVLLLFAWAIYLAAPWCFVGPPLLALFLTRFQIMPEERLMEEKFGQAYRDYKAKVRRWL